MPQARLYFQAPHHIADQAYRLLDRTFEDEGLALAILEIDEEQDLHEVSVYTTEDPSALKARVRATLDTLDPVPDILQEDLPDIDWVAHSLQGLTAVRAGRFYIHGSHERDGARAGEISVEIDAGLAFGTGHHGTTSGCLEMIERIVAQEHPQTVLDLGTGSAVLAIAIAKLARIPVIATDIDPVATEVARTNIRLNGVAPWVRAVTAPGFRHRQIAASSPYDLIVANILARPLMQLAPAMAQHAARGGSLILSGILERQRRSVIAAYVAQGFRHVSTLTREGWVTIHMKG